MARRAQFRPDSDRSILDDSGPRTQRRACLEVTQ
jgi:hypothetical protein